MLENDMLPTKRPTRRGKGKRNIRIKLDNDIPDAYTVEDTPVDKADNESSNVKLSKSLASKIREFAERNALENTESTDNCNTWSVSSDFLSSLPRGPLEIEVSKLQIHNNTSLSPSEVDRVIGQLVKKFNSKRISDLLESSFVSDYRHSALFKTLLERQEFGLLYKWAKMCPDIKASTIIQIITHDYTKECKAFKVPDFNPHESFTTHILGLKFDQTETKKALEETSVFKIPELFKLCLKIFSKYRMTHEESLPHLPSKEAILKWISVIFDSNFDQLRMCMDKKEFEDLAEFVSHEINLAEECLQLKTLISSLLYRQHTQVQEDKSSKPNNSNSTYFISVISE